MKHCKWTVSFCLLLMGLAGLSCPQWCEAEQVVAVYDGDTFTVASGQRIRLFGVDAPELSQPFGHASRDYLRRLILQKEVTLHCFRKSWGRQVCAAVVDHQSVSQAMVLGGMAFEDRRFSKGQYTTDEVLARLQGQGVWQLLEGGQRPWAYRRQRRCCSKKQKASPALKR